MVVVANGGDDGWWLLLVVLDRWVVHTAAFVVIITLAARFMGTGGLLGGRGGRARGRRRVPALRGYGGTPRAQRRSRRQAAP